MTHVRRNKSPVPARVADILKSQFIRCEKSLKRERCFRKGAFLLVYWYSVPIILVLSTNIPILVYRYSVSNLYNVPHTKSVVYSCYEKSLTSQRTFKNWCLRHTDSSSAMTVIISTSSISCFAFTCNRQGPSSPHIVSSASRPIPVRGRVRACQCTSSPHIVSSASRPIPMCVCVCVCVCVFY